MKLNNTLKSAAAALIIVMGVLMGPNVVASAMPSQPVAAPVSSISASDWAQIQASLKHMEAENNLMKQKLANQEVQLKQLQKVQAPAKQAPASSQPQSQNQTQFQRNRKPEPQQPTQDEINSILAEAKKSGDQFILNTSKLWSAQHNTMAILGGGYQGLRSSFDPNELIVQLPTMNEDLVYLQQRSDLQALAEKLGLPYSTPTVMLSGSILPQISYGKNYQSKATSNVNLYAAELNVTAFANDWVGGNVTLDYTNAPPASSFNGPNYSNSPNQFNLTRGFVSVGNLNEFPLYVSAGQMYLPFGAYGTSTITLPLTANIGRTLAPSAILGYSDYGIYAQGYMYKGQTSVGATTSTIINEGGLNAGYGHTFMNGDLSFDVGGGYISNIADSQNAQNNAITSGSQFSGFGVNSTTQLINHKVPGANAHASVRFHNVKLIGELITATKSFNSGDMSYNGQGAKPSASHVELNVDYHLFNKPMNVALAMDNSSQALAYNNPQKSYFVDWNIGLFKDTLISLEYRRDINYSSGDTGNGTTGGGSVGSPPITASGASQNTVTAQLSFYF